MIWVHCGDAQDVPATVSLVTRLTGQTHGAQITVTTEDGVRMAPLPQGAQAVPLPPDTPSKARAFLDAHTPRKLIWIGGTLHPTLLRAAQKSGVTATLVNARASDVFARGFSWLPRTTRTAVAPFQKIWAADGATATRLTRSGVEKSRVTVTGPILEEPVPLPHDQYELTVMAEALGTRPLWLAADVLSAEIPQVTAAHLAASRKSHRLLLLLSPRNLDHARDIAETLRTAGVRVGVRSDGDKPDAEHQVFIIDLPDELGLWYRISPLTFIGGTMAGGSRISPFDPILLGSAVLHGTRKAPHTPRYDRLANAQAAREVRSDAELGVALGTLISPENSARMALAGWEEITKDASYINTLVADCIAALEAPA